MMCSPPDKWAAERNAYRERMDAEMRRNFARMYPEGRNNNLTWTQGIAFFAVLALLALWGLA